VYYVLLLALKGEQNKSNKRRKRGEGGGREGIKDGG
jgi:hypothetical protein